MSRNFVKLCKQYHTFFEGAQIPVGATYGRSIVSGEEWFWLCQDYSGLSSGKLKVQFMKRTWNHNQNCQVRRMTWYTINVGKTHEVYKEVKSVLSELGFIPKVTSYKNPKKNFKVSMDDKSALKLRASRPNPVFRTKPLGGDNADKSPAVRNYNSYWAIHKDMLRIQ